MPSVTLGTIRSGALAGSAACVVCLGLSATPALAGDDGEAPMWESVGSIFAPIFTFGTGGQQKEPIEYRDHGKLVVPPKMDLPPPAAAAAGDPSWPRDPDVERRKKEKAKAQEIKTISGADAKTPPAPSLQSQAVGNAPVVTMSATAGMGPSGRRCKLDPGQTCQTQTGPSINWNPLTWVGLEKKPATVLGPEPDRDWLTDPPKGYREPAEGEGAHVDN
jgi:hypothetical protein